MELSRKYQINPIPNEDPIILGAPRPIPPLADPVLDAIAEFHRLAQLEDEAFCRIAVSVVFEAIPKSAWMKA
jgi:hypothetical protein